MMMEQALVVPRKNPPPMAWFCRNAPDPVVVALPLPLPKVRVNSPVLGAIEAVNEFVGRAPSLTKLLFVLTVSKEHQYMFT